MRKPSINPWLRPPSAQPTAVEPAPELELAPVAGPQLDAVAQPGTVRLGSSDALPTVWVPDTTGVGLWWVGAHGGAGESTLERLVNQTRGAGRAWPVSAPEEDEQPPLRVAICARTTASGLRAAQQLTCEWATGQLDVELVGLVLIADARGRAPRPLRDLATLVAGGAPEVWALPWVEAWRSAQPSLETSPGAIRRFGEEIAARFPAPAGTANQSRGQIDASHA